MTVTFEEFWEDNHERLEERCKVDTYGDPTTDRDNKAPISSRAMKVVSSECFEIFTEIGVVCDRVRLERLLRYLVIPDGPLVNPYEEARYLLEQLR